jgi:hypothetical protein
VRVVVRLALTILMNLLLVASGLLLARIVIAFFARVGSAPWAASFMDLTAPYVPALGFHAIGTPYRGVFDFNAAASLVSVMAAEWAVTFLRRFVR